MRGLIGIFLFVLQARCATCDAVDELGFLDNMVIVPKSVYLFAAKFSFERIAGSLHGENGSYFQRNKK